MRARVSGVPPWGCAWGAPSYPGGTNHGQAHASGSYTASAACISIFNSTHWLPLPGRCPCSPCVATQPHYVALTYSRLSRCLAGDALVAAAKALRLRHVQDLRRLQSQIDHALVEMQVRQQRAPSRPPSTCTLHMRVTSRADTLGQTYILPLFPSAVAVP